MKKPVIRDIARPAGKGDDLAKLLTSVVNRAIKNGAPVLVNQPVKKAAKKAKLNRVFKGSIMPKKGGIPRKKFEKFMDLLNQTHVLLHQRFSNRLHVLKLNGVAWRRQQEWRINIMASKPRKAFSGLARPTFMDVNEIYGSDKESKKMANKVFDRIDIPTDYRAQYIAEKDMQGTARKYLKGRKVRKPKGK